MPTPNKAINSVAFKKGLTEFECGACPECLRKRSNAWALRCAFEASDHVENCMVTLTYDNFARDAHGKIIGELPVDRSLHVSRDDIQKFIKRLRQHVFRSTGRKIKVFGSAEYGSRTHRAHYHLIIFGYCFPDCIYYKQSKRGHSIYMSKQLTSLWNHGICTVDSVTVNSAVGAYCSKYCSKGRGSDTFMIASRDIGMKRLLREFNGIKYIENGRLHPIPRQVWNIVISNRYNNKYFEFSYKYVNRSDGLDKFDRSRALRSNFRFLRDNDPQYRKYVEYWNNVAELAKLTRPDVLSRINLLPDSKFFAYKNAVLFAMSRRAHGVPVPAPGTKQFSAYDRYIWENFRMYPTHYDKCIVNVDEDGVICPCPSCRNRANDTKTPPGFKVFDADPEDYEIFSKNIGKSPSEFLDTLPLF
ncbi:replication initiator protein [Dipodfec virus UA06Rod_16]|uniref:Replication initiator protein n=1 Tax=Dipodfec virus UA06Rod_16 TaxID=2929317 RepID=A0A976N2P9_9VIRU|nr:replication initiator protein [Dipodfec virus UA06Rod_16]